MCLDVVCMEGGFSQIWSHITPVFKKGNWSTAANCRSISLTSVLCKVMEYIVFHHIMSYFTSLHILNPLQHGFRPNHSCETQLVNFIDEIQWSTNTRQQSDLLFIDFSKAFDTVPHRRLLNKLKFYGIQGSLLQWISSWLMERHQRVMVRCQTATRRLNVCKIWEWINKWQMKINVDKNNVLCYAAPIPWPPYNTHIL